MKKSILGLFLFLAVCGGALWFFKFRSQESAGYKAVFLSNGQVYFGRLEDGGANYKRMNDVYYLVTFKRSAEDTDVQRVLRKLGDKELHGPENSMLINEKHILYIEDLKEDGKVVTAIGQYNDSDGIAPAKEQAPVEATPVEESEEEGEEEEDITEVEGEAEEGAEEESIEEEGEMLAPTTSPAVE